MKKEAMKKDDIISAIHADDNFKAVVEKVKNYEKKAVSKKKAFARENETAQKKVVIRKKDDASKPDQYSESVRTSDFRADAWFRKNFDDVRFYRPIKMIKKRIFAHKRILIIMHTLNNNDLAKFFYADGHIVTINDERYVFNPAHIRYVNGLPVLYLFEGNPFSKLINVNDSYIEPTISSEAFSAILESKYVIDAVKGEGANVNMILTVVVVIIMLVLVIMTIINIVSLNKISKALGV